MINIILADDNNAVRQSMRVILENEPDFHILAEARNGKEALQSVKRLHPDILLLDLIMPVINGFEVAREVKKLSTGTKIVVLTIHDSEAYVAEALKSGALGYVVKNSDSGEMIKAIREAAAGRSYLGLPLSRDSVEIYRKRYLTQ
jgi:DNA-binding NarL/FixJ family response regulator